MSSSDQTSREVIRGRRSPRDAGIDVHDERAQEARKDGEMRLLLGGPAEGENDGCVGEEKWDAENVDGPVRRKVRHVLL